MAPESKPAEGEQQQQQQQATEQKPEQKPAASLGEDDEFEDFPVDDWPADQTEAAQDGGDTKHLWEESWDDDDMTDDFSAQLKEELKRVDNARRR
ncbi:putative 26S proteasome complex subunit sem-1 [Escovopsis weberi]|uniref:26S proteasome complex subunit SEM1 n=1 Tax=Escovopsis weberi TaxID=150374 RepID=A0A0M9VWU0_ESCWE|nr:putative 26S proteasome complex subunit sem-1 [Escovopsis weberi]